MTKEKMVGDVPGKVLGMIADLAHKLRHGTLTPEELGLFLKREDPFERSNWFLEWMRFYKEVFGLSLDFSKIPVCKKREGFNWLFFMAPGLTANKIFDKCSEYFNVWRCRDDLDKEIGGGETWIYSFWLRDRIMADEENKNLSAQECRQKNIYGLNLNERMLLELWYYWKTAKHLDEDASTLCIRSHYLDGMIPSVGWGFDKMQVEGFRPDYSSIGLRARSFES
jgi:hypothetical protein